MADDVTFSSATLASPPSGTVVATDDVGSKHYQLVKIALGAANAVDMHLDSGQQVMASSVPVALASDHGDIKITLDGESVTVASHAVTNAGTFVVQIDGAALTALQAADTDLTTIIGHVDGIEGHVDGIEALLGTIDADTSGIITAVELLDNAVVVLGTTTYTEATSSGYAIGAVRRDADTTLVGTTNEWGPLQMDANGRLKVEAFSGEALPVTLTSTTVTGTVAVTQSGTWDEVGINDSGNSITVDNGGTFAVQVDGNALTALQLIDDVVYTDDTSTHATGTSKGVGIMAAAVPTDTSISANDIGMVGMTTDRRLYVEAVIAATQTLTTVTTVGTVSALGVGTTGPQKAEDIAHATGDMGIFTLGVRMDSPNATFGASNDYGPFTTDMAGGIRTALYETDFAVLGTKHTKKYYTNAGAVTDGIVWSPAAGTRWYVTDIYIQTSAAATITLEDDLVAGDAAVWKGEFAANSGWSHSFTTPLFSGEDAADLIITTSAGNVYVTVTGYEI